MTLLIFVHDVLFIKRFPFHQNLLLRFYCQYYPYHFVEERSQQYNFFSREIFHLYRHHQTLLFCAMYYTTMYYISYNTINVKYLNNFISFFFRKLSFCLCPRKFERFGTLTAPKLYTCVDPSHLVCGCFQVVEITILNLKVHVNPDFSYLPLCL